MNAFSTNSVIQKTPNTSRVLAGNAFAQTAHHHHAQNTASATFYHVLSAVDIL